MIMTYYSTGEVSKKLGISVRTLRYYDQISLITPSFKNDNGNRHYSDEDILTIEKITILKNLALPLEDIKKVLSKVTIKQLLNVHRDSLKDKIQDLEASVLHTNTLLNILHMDGDLNWEQLILIIKNSEGSQQKKNIAWSSYFHEDEQALMTTRLPKMEQNDGHTAKWINIIRRIELCLSNNTSPTSEEGQIIAEDVLLLSEEAFGGDRELEEKFWNVRRSAADSESLNLYPIREEVITFLEDAMSKKADEAHQVGSPA